MATTSQVVKSGKSVNNNRKNLAAWSEWLSERGWFLLSLVLFIVLGPFSGPVALIVLIRLGLKESAQALPESILLQ